MIAIDSDRGSRGRRDVASDIRSQHQQQEFSVGVPGFTDATSAGQDEGGNTNPDVQGRISMTASRGGWDDLWVNGNLATMAGGDGYGAVEDGAIAAADGRIAWIGRRADLPGAPESLAGALHDLAGRWVTPGLIDCHTHIVFGGNRAAEFEQRLQGATYEEIARAGALAAEGVTVLEIKSGYGLDVETELRMLRVARRLGERLPLRVVATFLGAHAIPPEFEGRADAYLDLVVEEALPAAAKAGLVDAVDAFCERIAFSPAQTARVFEAAGRLGLPVKLHADQLSDLGGAALAARYRALSAEHLEYASEDGLHAMAAAGTVAVLLPGAFYFLREARLPPIDALRRHGVPIAIATDCNPGSAPAVSLLLMLNMACTLFRMTPGEALAGITRNAAQVLGLSASHGTLAAGKAADFVAWDIGHPAELAYWIGANPCAGVVRNGRAVTPLGTAGM
jgi:imidazolonepropionase